MLLKTWFEKIWKKDKPHGRLSIEPAYPYVPKLQEVKYRFIDPAYPRTVLKEIEKYVMNTPVLSETHNLIISLANTGHEVEIVTEDEKMKAQAQQELEQLAFQLNTDQLVLQLFSQIALYGCVSAEIVVSQKLDGINDIVRVHPASVYFDLNKETQQYEPYQWVGLEQPIKLNPVTYKYIPILTIDGSPYAIPPFLAAIQIADAFMQFVGEVKGLATKVGLLGFLDVKFPLLQRSPSETDTEYMERARKFLEQAAQDIASNINKGILVHFEGTEAQFKEVKADAGFSDLLATLEKWQVAGAKGQPALVGFSTGYTETWATVALYVFIKQIGSWQTVVKRFLEYAYKLHFSLKGMFVDDINVKFNPLPDFHPEREAEAESKKAQAFSTYIDAIQKALQAGVMTQEEAKQMYQFIINKLNMEV